VFRESIREGILDIRFFSPLYAHSLEKHWRGFGRRNDCSSRVLDCSGGCTSYQAWGSTRKPRRPSDYGGCFGSSCVRYLR
jgi:hypothetical protein